MNKSELLVHSILSTNHSVQETVSNCNTVHKIRTQPKNNTDQIKIYNKDINAGFTFSEFHQHIKGSLGRK